MTNIETIHIAFCSDKNYIMPTGVAMISVCENNQGENFHFHIVLTGSDRDEELKLKAIADKYGKILSLYYIDKERLDPFKCSGTAVHVTPTGFARIFLPELLSCDIDRVIYLDSDIAVVGPLRGLWEYNLDDSAPIAACIDTNVVDPVAHERVNLPSNIPYCNSGVLLFNLRCWRKEGLQEKICAVSEEKKFPLLDQDAINYLFRDQIKILPIKFNVQLGFYLSGCDYLTGVYRISKTFDDALKNPVVIHYSYPEKPWKYKGLVHGERWWQYANVSPWKDLLASPAESSSFITFREIQRIRIASGIFPDQFLKNYSVYTDMFLSVVRLRHGSILFGFLSLIIKSLTKISDIVYSHNLKNQLKSDRI